MQSSSYDQMQYDDKHAKKSAHIIKCVSLERIYMTAME